MKYRWVISCVIIRSSLGTVVTLIHDFYFHLLQVIGKATLKLQLCEFMSTILVLGAAMFAQCSANTHRMSLSVCNSISAGGGKNDLYSCHLF